MCQVVLVIKKRQTQVCFPVCGEHLNSAVGVHFFLLALPYPSSEMPQPQKQKHTVTTKTPVGVQIAG